MAKRKDMDRAYSTPKNPMKIGTLNVDNREVDVFCSRKYLGTNNPALYVIIDQLWYKLPKEAKWQIK